ncbi:hypothetical protein D3C86_1813290 [compost metagenome]
MGLGPAITMGDQRLAYATGSVVLIPHHSRDAADGQRGEKRDGFIDVDPGRQKAQHPLVIHRHAEQPLLTTYGRQQKLPLLG